jgi:hypothetical protein
MPLLDIYREDNLNCHNFLGVNCRKPLDLSLYPIIDPLPILTYFGVSELPQPKVIDYKFIEFTPEEQLLMLVNRLQSLGRFRFMTKTAVGEGDLRGTLKRITIERLDRNQFPNEHILAPIRRQLAKRDGVPVEKLLAEIPANDIRRTSPIPKKQLEQVSTPAILKDDNVAPSTQPNNPVSIPRPDGDNDFWERRVNKSGAHPT